MKKDFWISGLKENWYLVAAFVILTGVALVYGLTRQASAPENVPPPQRSSGAPASDVEAIPADPGPFRPGGTNKAKAEENIERYKAELYEAEQKGDQTSEEVALGLRRIANLYYSPLQNYEEAVNWYEVLLTRFPDWEGLEAIYPNLAEAYRRLGKLDMERDTYRRMLEYYPPESQYYLFAQEKLDI